jgi:diacylglycerol kinase family enzyme
MYRADESTEKLHMISYKAKKSLIKLIPLFPKIWAGKPLPDDLVLDKVGSKIIIESEKKFRYIIDGDVYVSTGKLVVEAGPVIDIIVE